MRASPILTNFTSGEWSPRLNGRVDISKYYNACRTLQNMYVFPHGGATRRFGTVFVAECKDSTKLARLIPFQFSITQAYILEFGDTYIRFYKDNGQIASGASAYEISSPYTETQLADIKYAQDADTMRLVNQSVSPMILTRTGHTAWTMSSITFTAQPADWAASSYPGAIAIYEQRGVYAATPDKPQTLWFSVVGNLDDMSTGTAADDGMDLTIDDNNVIRWLITSRQLNVGTTEGTWIVSGSSTDEAITPTSRKARKTSGYGCSTVQAAYANNAILFVQRVGRKLRELIYDYIQDNFGDPPDLSLLAEHITDTGIKAMAFQKEPDSILWMVLNDGSLVGLTYNKAQEIVGWHHHDTDGEFEDVAVIPVSDHDQVWFIVKRTIGGTDKRYIEYMAPDFGTEQNACWFVDCGLQYSGAAATTLTGMDHLEGKTVSILADGAVAADASVVSGAVVIANAASSVTIGLPYTSVLEPMDLEVAGQGSTAQTKRMKIHSAAVRFYNTLGAKIGTDSGTMDIIPFRSASDPMDSAPPLFTGDKVVAFPGGWDRHGYIRISQEQPLPMTVLAIVPEVNVND